MEPPSKRRLAENEVMFRTYNEQIKSGFDTIKKVAKEDSQAHTLQEIDIPLHFYCECSNEKCDMRIIMKPSTYTRIHKIRDHFIVLKGHQNESIERIIRQTKEYDVIEKYTPPPKTAHRLNPT